MQFRFILASLAAASSLAYLAPAAVAGDIEDHYKEFEKKEAQYNLECRQLEKLPYPAADQPARPMKALLNCDARGFYYGIHSNVDYANARICAFSTNGGDPAVLMMEYANGQSVSRNFIYAKKAACELEGAPAELVGRLDHLNAMAQALDRGDWPKNIDFCDDITSGSMKGFCAAIKYDLVEKKLNKNYSGLTRQLSDAQKEAFNNLRNAASSFMDSRSNLEVDQTGTARAEMSIDGLLGLEIDLQISLSQFEKGNLPSYSEAQFAAEDQTLNRIFARIMRQRGFSYGTVTAKDIQQVQRNWLVYRDALVEFGSVRYPQVPAYAWETYITKKRVAMLKLLLGELEPVAAK